MRLRCVPLFDIKCFGCNNRESMLFLLIFMHTVCMGECVYSAIQDVLKYFSLHKLIHIRRNISFWKCMCVCVVTLGYVFILAVSSAVHIFPSISISMHCSSCFPMRVSDTHNHSHLQELHQLDVIKFERHPGRMKRRKYRFFFLLQNLFVVRSF